MREMLSRLRRWRLRRHSHGHHGLYHTGNDNFARWARLDRLPGYASMMIRHDDDAARYGQPLAAAIKLG